MPRKALNDKQKKLVQAFILRMKGVTISVRQTAPAR